VFVRPNETVEFAAALMAENKISSLPVLSDQDKLVGIITETDVFKVFIHITGFYTGGIQFGFSLEDRPGSIKEVADILRSYGGRIVSILSTNDMAKKSKRNVYIRITGILKDKVEPLIDELERKFVVLYTGHDFLDELERRRVRVAH
jgi:acetoin utilization protein AcuB